MTGVSPDIFLSYARGDQATARRFAQALEGEGFSVWWDQTLSAGEAFDQVTEKALNYASMTSLGQNVSKKNGRACEMAATHNTAYVQDVLYSGFAGAKTGYVNSQNGRNEDMLNAVSGPFAESNFLSLRSKRRRRHEITL